MGLPTEFLASTRWVQPTDLDLDSGEERHGEKYVDKGLLDALLDPVQFSPARDQAIDRRMRLWAVPR
jgi:hypothetical protein